MRKKKKLPNNFKELIDSGDLNGLKAVFDTCELNAYDGCEKNTALAFSLIPDELVRWLAEQGADINVKNQYQRTPLHEQASAWRSNIPLFLEMGADIEAADNRQNTPLHAAAGSFRLHAVKDLLAYGADCNAKNDLGQTPLEKMLSLCRNADIEKASKIAELLINAGTPVNDEMKRHVEHIGTEFEFYKEDFNKKYVEGTGNALLNLYKLFGVTPVPPRRMLDGMSSITVSASGWQAQHKELWDLLVPGSGYAKTVQGEVIRITGRISYEILDNGGINWDSDFTKMLHALSEYLSSGNPLEAGEQKEINSLVSIISSNSSEKDVCRLTELAVHWVLANPAPVKMERPNYKR